MEPGQIRQINFPIL